MRVSALVALTTLALCLFSAPAKAGGFPTANPSQYDPRELRLLAFQKYLEGSFEESRNLYMQAITAAENEYGKDSSFVADLCYEVGSISLEDGQFHTAEKFLKKAVEQKPNSVMARVKYAELLKRRKMDGDAFVQIQQALKTSPGSPIAQQAMVKWMMDQASHRTAEGAIANVAATWECYRLRGVGKNSVTNTMANITRWRNGFMKATPQVKVAVATPPPPKVVNPIKDDGKIKPDDKIKKTVRTATTVVARAKPRVVKVKPALVIKPVEITPDPVKIAREPARPKVEKHTIVASTPSTKRSKAGLVPPPPPLVPVYMPPPPPNGFASASLEATGKVVKEKPKKKIKPPPSEQEEDPEYLLQWGADEKKGKSSEE